MSSLIAAPVRADDSKEYLVKAAFIYNFVKFVSWPGERAISKQSHIDICVVGDSPMDQAQAVFQKGSSDKLALSLVSERSVEKAAEHCHIVFIGGSEESKLGTIFSLLKGKPVLTVSDIDGFAERGGMIGFIMEDNKVKLMVNTRPAATAGMRIDAQLLEIALKVIDK